MVPTQSERFRQPGSIVTDAGTPQGCVLGPILCTPFPHDCVASFIPTAVRLLHSKEEYNHQGLYSSVSAQLAHAQTLVYIHTCTRTIVCLHLHLHSSFSKLHCFWNLYITLHILHIFLILFLILSPLFGILWTANEEFHCIGKFISLLGHDFLDNRFDLI